MDIIERVKGVLLNPKEEWEIIEAEGVKPHVQIFSGYLLLLALIPAAALFFTFWREWNSEMQEAIQLLIDSNADDRSISIAKENNPFIAIVGIIDAATTFVTIVLGAYISAGVLNALSDNFGVQKDFNRAFTLIAYSCTPLCIGGLLYAYPPLSSIAPYIGLYGLYLLYAGIKPVINPPVAKASNCFIIGVAVMLAAYFFIPKIVQPVAVDIKMKVLTEQVREMAKKNNGNFNEKYFPRYLKESMKDFNEKDFQRYLNEHMKDLR